MATTGVKQFWWVTTITVAGLIFGATVANAAKEPPGQAGGHQQQAAQFNEDHPGRGLGLLKHAESADDAENQGEEAVADTVETQVVTPASVTGIGIVTPPGQLEERPGWGCGDVNHIHLGPPGNPDAPSPCE